MRNQANKLSVLSLSIAAALCSFTAHAELDPNDATNQSVAAVDLSEQAKKAFYEESKLNLHTFLYIRDREERKPGEDFNPQIENQTLQLAFDYRSGYFKDFIGLDLWGSTLMKIGDTYGQSEILLYDYDCDNDGVGGDFCEKTNTSLNIAALKMKLGDEELGFAARAGYTRIDMGTIRSSWGLNPHTYRGAEGKLSVGNFHVGYAWADQFKNDWTDEFKDMTNRWHQGDPSMSAAGKIDFIHSVGAIYELENGVIDLGYGQGKDYRDNWQALVKYSWDLNEDAKLNTSFFYHGGKYVEGDLSGVDDASNESYIGLGADIKNGGFTFRMAYSQTDAPDTSSYNFRLTPWANSDNRNFMQTTSQIEDYNPDGTKAIKLGVDFNFKSWGIPELSIGLGGNYGWDVVSDTGVTGDARTYDGTMYSIDYNVRYRFLEGDLKGLNINFFPAYFRSEDTNYKYDRNDMKLMLSYSYGVR
ncbi:OprD family outer membrane porin [Enterovibrio norvegicus]|uniref:OprD family outer membrane porin n=1 Tax=Enterovibrio norvegicus TaxID=188144 RepID=UPI0024B0782C|nr:OprD family outer membrane porin [Enterovibrio norvegicus]